MWNQEAECFPIVLVTKSNYIHTIVKFEISRESGHIYLLSEIEEDVCSHSMSPQWLWYMSVFCCIVVLVFHQLDASLLTDGRWYEQVLYDGLSENQHGL